MNACLLHKNGKKQIEKNWNCEQEKHVNPNIQEDQMIVFINWFFGRMIDQLVSEIQKLVKRFDVMIHSLVSLKKLFIFLNQMIKSLLGSWSIIAADPHFYIWLLAVKLSCPLLVLMIIPRFPSMLARSSCFQRGFPSLGRICWLHRVNPKSIQEVLQTYCCNEKLHYFVSRYYWINFG